MNNCSIIIPHYNGEDILIRCLESLFQYTSSNHEIIIVDNASSDNSVKIIKKQKPQIPSSCRLSPPCTMKTLFSSTLASGSTSSASESVLWSRRRSVVFTSPAVEEESSSRRAKRPTT